VLKAMLLNKLKTRMAVLLVLLGLGPVPLLVALVTLMTTPQGASAIVLEVQATPATMNKGIIPFTVKVTDVDQLKEFEVTLAGKAGEEAKFFQAAKLTLADGGKEIASCPVAVARTNGDKDLVFTFRVSPKVIGDSTFSLMEIIHKKDADGRMKLVGPSANRYWFYLKDYDSTEDAPKPPKD
jgi:hypothetical protein